MARIKIANKHYDYPEDWQDITLDKFSIYLKIEMPTGLHIVTTEHESDQWREQVLELPLSEQAAAFEYFMSVLNHFCNIDKDVLVRCKLQQVETLFWKLFNLLNTVCTAEYTETIEHNGQTYYLPSEFMQNSTVGDFLEACQLEMEYSKLKNGKFQHLAKLMCILCRRSKTEQYSDALLARESIFKQFSMDKVWQVAFFLQQRNRKYQEGLATYTKLALKGILKLQQDLSN